MPGAAHESRGLSQGLRFDDSALQAVLTVDRRPVVFWWERGRSWAVRRRRGDAAKAIVEEALHPTDKTLDEALRDAQAPAILYVLGEPLLQMFQETFVNLDNMPESLCFVSFVSSS